MLQQPEEIRQQLLPTGSVFSKPLRPFHSAALQLATQLQQHQRDFPSNLGSRSQDQVAVSLFQRPSTLEHEAIADIQTHQHHPINDSPSS